MAFTGNLDAHASIEDLQTFRQALLRYEQSLESETNAAILAMNTVNETWHDKVSIKFMTDFEQSLYKIAQMRELIDNYQNYVGTRIAALEDYMGVS